MANSISNVGFTDYDAERADIERRRAYAQALSAEGQKPLEGQTAGGWTIPISPFQGLAKVFQAYSGRKGQEQAAGEQKQLGQRYQSELANTLMRARQAGTGTPASVSPGSELSPAFETPAVAPDLDKAASLYMAHPETRAMGLKMMADSAQQQQLQAMVDAMRRKQGPVQGNPMAPGGGVGSSVMAGSGEQPAQGQAPQGSDPLSGLDPNAVPFLMSQNTQANEMGKLLQASFLEANKPQNVRPEGTVAVPDGHGGYRQAYYSAKVGEGQTRDPSGAASIIPGYLGNQAALGKTPMTQVQNADQTHSYIPTAQLTQAANAAPIPGATPSQQAMPPQAAQPPVNPQQPIVPGTNMSNPPMSMVPPEDRAAFNAAIPQRNKVPVAPTPAAPAGGAPRFGQTQEQQIEQARQTAGGKAVDEQFAKDYVAFTTGGAQDSAKQLGQLGDVVKELENPQANLTGPILGKTPDFVKSFTNPQSIAMKERVDEVVQRSLRVILGAQFTEKEGERLIARAYNPSLPESENAVRVSRLYTQLQQAYEAKQSATKYYEQNGTLQGWRGKLPSISDFDLDATKGKIGAAAGVVYARNPKTGERIQSTDGGKNWKAAQ